MIQKEKKLISGKGELEDILRFLTDSLLANMSYTDISSTAKEIIMAGKAANRQDIIIYTTTLVKSGKFSEVRITSISGDKNDELANDPQKLNFGLIIER
jgi:hypothetical protein